MAWIRGNGEKIVSDIANGGRYSVFPTGELHIRHVTKKDEFQSYHCVTRHALSDRVSKSTVAGRLMVNDPRSSVPPRITDSRSVVEAKVGDTIELPCAAQGYPIPQYKWLKNLADKDNQNEHLVRVKPDARIRLVGGSLLIKSVQAQDDGKYVCLVSSTVGEERALTTLSVWAPLSAHIRPQIQTVDVGGEAKFHCQIDGFPMSKIKWLKDGEKINFDSRVRQISIRKISVQNVTRNDKGIYQCIASNEKDAVQASSHLILGDASPYWLNTSSSKVVCPGAEVVLTCVVQGSPPPLLEWKLRGEVVTRSNNRLELHNEISKDIVTGQLLIHSISVEDGGIWSCSASNRAGSITHRQRLNVRGPPSIRPMPHRDVVAGQTSWFDCVVVGYPIDSIHWEKKGVVLPILHRQKVHSNGTLEVRQVSRDSDGGEYTCVATAGEKNVRSNVRVDVSVPPVIDQRLFSWGDGHKLGSPGRIICVALRGDLPLRFRWYHNDQPLTTKSTSSLRYLDDQTSILLFTSFETSDSGNYTCKVSNKVATDSHTSFLLVKVAPGWKNEPRDASVIVGSSVRIACEAEGSPAPNITWKRAVGETNRKYVSINTLGENVQVSDDSSLSIRTIKRNQGGELLCIASNGEGSDLSKTVKITVKVPPQFEKKVENITVTAGNTVNVSCISYGNLPIKIIWSKGNPPKKIPQEELQNTKFYNIKTSILNENLSRNPDKKTLNSSEAASRVENASFDDEKGVISTITVVANSMGQSDLYTCLASNIYGSDTKSINLIIQEVPAAPGSPRVAEVGSRSVNLTWGLPAHNGNAPILIYRILIINSSESWMDADKIRGVETSSMSAVIDSLSPAQSYSVRVIAINSIGASLPSAETNVATIHEPPTSAPKDVSVIPISSTSVRVTWLIQESPITRKSSYGYYIGYKLANASGPFRYETVRPNNDFIHRQEVVLAQLRKFTLYVITIQAFNQAGVGPKSKAVLKRTLEDVPSEAPLNVSCYSVTSTSIALKWFPPPHSAINGLLLGYKIIYGPQDERLLKDVQELYTNITNLNAYSNYSLQISAYTRKGSGVQSDAITCQTLEDVPGIMSDFKAFSVNGNTIGLSWLPPNPTNGKITKYAISMKMIQSPSQYSKWSGNKNSNGFAPYSNFYSRDAKFVRWGENSHKSLLGTSLDESFEVDGNETHYLATNVNNGVPYSFSIRAATSVGKGRDSRTITQKATNESPAVIASFSQKFSVLWNENISLPCLSFGQPSPQRNWLFNGISLNDKFEKRVKYHINGTMTLSQIRGTDAGNFTCQVSNMHGRDFVTYALTVKSANGRGAPAKAPELYIKDVRENALVIMWNDQGFIDNIIGYYIFVKTEYGDWERHEVGGAVKQHSLANLRCGSAHQIYVTSFNKAGPSPPSEIISTRTLGGEPIFPSRSAFIMQNYSSLILRLSAWIDQGCPISSFVIELKQKSTGPWRLVSNIMYSGANPAYVLKDLLAETSYDLRVTAHNEAGSTPATYQFFTSKTPGSNVNHLDYLPRNSHWFSSSSLAAAAICSFVILASLVGGVVGLFLRKGGKFFVPENEEGKEVNTNETPQNGTLVRRKSMTALEAFLPVQLDCSSHRETLSPLPLPSPPRAPIYYTIHPKSYHRYEDPNGIYMKDLNRKYHSTKSIDASMYSYSEDEDLYRAS